MEHVKSFLEASILDTSVEQASKRDIVGSEVLLFHLHECVERVVQLVGLTVSLDQYSVRD